jgi:hypothetical protein
MDATLVLMEEQEVENSATVATPKIPPRED